MSNNDGEKVVPQNKVMLASRQDECHLQNLPHQLILHIMSYLDLASLVKFSFTCKTLYKIASYPKLWESLDLSHEKFGSGQMVDMLKRNPAYLKMAFAQVSEHQLLLKAPLLLPENMSFKLSYLDMSFALVSEKNLTSLISISKNLRRLSLEGLSVGHDILTGMPVNLDCLNLCMASNVPLHNLNIYLRNAKKLKALNLGWIKEKWTSSEFLALINSLPPSLVQLNISGYPMFMTDLSVGVLVEKCEFLRRLDLSDSYQLTEDSTKYINKLEWIISLAVNRCIKIGIAGFQRLRSKNQIKELEIFGAFPDKDINEICKALQPMEVNQNPYMSVARPTNSLFSSKRIWNKTGRRIRDLPAHWTRQEFE